MHAPTAEFLVCSFQAVGAIIDRLLFNSKSNCKLDLTLIIHHSIFMIHLKNAWNVDVPSAFHIIGQQTVPAKCPHCIQ